MNLTPLSRIFTFQSDLSGSSRDLNELTIPKVVFEYRNGNLKAKINKADGSHEVHVIAREKLNYGTTQEEFQRCMTQCECELLYLEALDDYNKPLLNIVSQIDGSSPYYVNVKPRWHAIFPPSANSCPIIKIEEAFYPPLSTQDLVYLSNILDQQEAETHGIDTRTRLILHKLATDILGSLGSPEWQCYMEDLALLPYLQNSDQNYAFTRALIQFLITKLNDLQENDRILRILCATVEQAPEGALDRNNLLSILEIIKKYLEHLEECDREIEKLNRALEFCGNILDALQRDTQKLDRLSSYQPLYKTLSRLQSNSKYSFQAGYALQSLIRIGHSESIFAALWRRAKAMGMGFGHFIAGLKKHELSYLQSAYENFQEVVHRDVKPLPWYREMHCLRFLVRFGHLRDAEHFVHEKVSIEKKSIITLGFCSLMHDVALYHHDVSIQENAVRMLLDLVANHDLWRSDQSTVLNLINSPELAAQRRAVESLVNIIQSGDQTIASFARDRLSLLVKKLKSKNAYLSAVVTAICPDVQKLKCSKRKKEPLGVNSTLFSSITAKYPEFTLCQKMKDRQRKKSHSSSNFQQSDALIIQNQLTELDDAVGEYPQLEISDVPRENRREFIQRIEIELLSSWDIGKPWPLVVKSSRITIENPLGQILRSQLQLQGFNEKEIEYIEQSNHPITVILDQYRLIEDSDCPKWNLRFVFITGPRNLLKGESSRSEDTRSQEVIQALPSFDNSAEQDDIIKRRLKNPSKKLGMGESLEIFQRCIYYGQHRAFSARNKDVVLYIGKKGSGKSTLVNFLSGCTMNSVAAKKVNSSNPHRAIVVQPTSNGGALDEVMKIGHKKTSETFMPQIYSDPITGLTHVDCPGFRDNRGPEIDIANGVNILRIIKEARSVKVIALIDYYSIFGSRSESLSDFVRTCYDLFGEQIGKYTQSMLIGITHVPLQDYSLDMLQNYVLEDGLEALKKFKGQFFITDPLGRPLKGGLSRHQLIERIQSLRPIKDPASVFRAPINDTNELELKKISEEISRKVEKHLKRDDFLRALHYLGYLEKLALIDRDVVRNLIESCQRLIFIQIDHIVSEFKLLCTHNSFDRAEEILDNLKVGISLLEHKLNRSINLKELQVFYQLSVKRYEREESEKKAARKTIETALEDSREQVAHLIFLMEEQKKNLNLQLEQQREELMQLLRQMETSREERLMHYRKLQNQLVKEMQQSILDAQERLKMESSDKEVLDQTIREASEKIKAFYELRIQKIEREKTEFEKQEKLREKAATEALERRQGELRDSIRKLEHKQRDAQAEVKKQQRLQQDEVKRTQDLTLEQSRLRYIKRIKTQDQPLGSPDSNICRVCREKIWQGSVQVQEGYNFFLSNPTVYRVHLYCLGKAFNDWSDNYYNSEHYKKFSEFKAVMTIPRSSTDYAQQALINRVYSKILLYLAIDLVLFANIVNNSTFRNDPHISIIELDTAPLLELGDGKGSLSSIALSKRTMPLSDFYSRNIQNPTDTWDSDNPLNVFFLGRHYGRYTLISSKLYVVLRLIVVLFHVISLGQIFSNQRRIN